LSHFIPIRLEGARAGKPDLEAVGRVGKGLTTRLKDEVGMVWMSQRIFKESSSPRATPENRERTTATAPANVARPRTATILVLMILLLLAGIYVLTLPISLFSSVLKAWLMQST